MEREDGPQGKISSVFADDAPRGERGMWRRKCLQRRVLPSGFPLHVDRALPSTTFSRHTHPRWDSIDGRGTAAGLGRKGGSHPRR